MAVISQNSFKRIEKDRFGSDLILRPTITYWQDAWRRLRKNPIALASLVILVLFVVMVIIGPYIRGYDYTTIVAKNKNLAPSSAYWFGTDNLGRDLFSRVWLGARASLIVAIVCTLIQLVIGCTYGGIMAYFGGVTDNVMMRIIEVITSLPSLLITMLVMMVLGNSLFALLTAMCLTSWCGTARQVRGQIMQLRESEYIMAAITLGASPFRIITKHLLPNTLGLLILNLASSIPDYIFTEAGLSFLGMGLQAPNTSLGILISLGQTTMDFHPNQLFFPAAVLCVIVLAFNLFGDGLRDALDPKLRK
ncbi:ABC transporter permease [Anaerocolumna sp. AGMB13020]|uniref:ABC transporter permease n=1 Tax=Anaerocolumna sp. AGMB13020 TaxID=3081750 RepID=UPI002953872A|nr:ABC transporter permease [Anaerocolumna sp. AGMB13020]WOO37663.1 ABC transporter permease [Anaerocolumna sp. AGMB13020]